MVWGSVLVGLAMVLLVLRLNHETHPLQEIFENELATDPHDVLANFLIGLVPSLSLQVELVLGAVALLYACVEAVEIWGLWVKLTWVEALVLIETAGFIPYELWELARQFQAFKIASLVINVLIVWYLAGRYVRRRQRRKSRTPSHRPGLRSVVTPLQRSARNASWLPMPNREG